MEGENKLLLKWRGRTILERAIEEALKTGYATVVITGHEKERIEKTAEHYPITLIYNEHHMNGQDTSIRTALEMINDDTAFLPADLPFITSDDINRAIEESEGYPTTRPLHDNTPGHPVIISKELREKILRQEDKQVRAIIKEEGCHTFPGTKACIWDVDTPSAYKEALSFIKSD